MTQYVLAWTSSCDVAIISDLPQLQMMILIIITESVDSFRPYIKDQDSEGLNTDTGKTKRKKYREDDF